MIRAVSVLEVASAAHWPELEAEVDLAAYTERVLDDRRRVVTHAFDRQVMPRLGELILVRYARRDAAQAERARSELDARVANLRHDVRAVLRSAQRHAVDGLVIGRQAWDPTHDAAAVRALQAAELMISAGDEDLPYTGRFRLHPDLPDPPPVVYQFTDAAMPETEDLPDAPAGPLALLHDMASLAAAIEHVPTRVTHSGTISVTDARRIGRHLGATDVARSGHLDAHPRWGRALRALGALGAATPDPLSRQLQLDLGLELTLEGDAAQATDRLIHRLVDADLHVVVPAIRAAIRDAGDGAVDELLFLELLRDQHRDVLMPAWHRDGLKVYPTLGDEPGRPYDDAAFDEVEARMIRAVLHRLTRIGVLRRAPGVFSATPDGRLWAGLVPDVHPPIWLSGDLEMIVPPGALTAWERFQIERLGACLQRDTVDRFKLSREALRTWLSTHDVDEALALLHRRCPRVPELAEETLRMWAEAACRFTLTRGVVIET